MSLVQLRLIDVMSAARIGLIFVSLFYTAVRLSRTAIGIDGTGIDGSAFILSAVYGGPGAARCTLNALRIGPLKLYLDSANEPQAQNRP